MYYEENSLKQPLHILHGEKNDRDAALRRVRPVVMNSPILVHVKNGDGEECDKKEIGLPKMPICHSTLAYPAHQDDTA